MKKFSLKLKALVILCLMFASGLATNYLIFHDNPIRTSNASSGLAIDGTASNHCASSSSCSATLSTTSANDVIYASCNGANGAGGSVSSFSDGSQLTWTLRKSVSAAKSTLETYYAISTAALSSDTITCNYSESTNLIILVFGISGANTASPFDPNSGLPDSNTCASSCNKAQSVTVSTNNANDMILGIDAVFTATTYTAGSGFSIAIQQSGGPSAAAEYEVVSSTQSSLSITMSSSAGSTPWAMIGDAIQASGSGSTNWASLYGVNYINDNMSIAGLCCSHNPQTDIPNIHSDGFNLLRVAFSWAKYKSNPASFNWTVNQIVKYANQYNMKIIWTGKQDSNLANNGGSQDNLGDYFPSNFYGSLDNYNFYTDWWKNSSALIYDGKGAWEADWSEVWVPLIQLVDKQKCTLGYEISTEPHLFGASAGDLQRYNQWFTDQIASVSQNQVAWMGNSYDVSTYASEAPKNEGNLIADVHCYIGNSPLCKSVANLTTNLDGFATGSSGLPSVLAGSTYNDPNVKVWIGEWDVCGPSGSCPAQKDQSQASSSEKSLDNSTIMSYVSAFKSAGVASTYWIYAWDTYPGACSPQSLLDCTSPNGQYWIDTYLQTDFGDFGY